MKRIKKQKGKKKLAHNIELSQMTEQERLDLNKPVIRTLKEIVDMQVWDFEHRQLPQMKYEQFTINLNKRMIEVLDEHSKSNNDVIKQMKHKEYTKLKEVLDKVKL